MDKIRQPAQRTYIGVLKSHLSQLLDISHSSNPQKRVIHTSITNTHFKDGMNVQYHKQIVLKTRHDLITCRRMIKPKPRPSSRHANLLE